MSDRTMRVYNLTDVETNDLIRRGLTNKTIAVRSVLVRPGESKDVPDDATSRRDIQSFEEIGVLSVDKLPPEYSLAKARMTSSKKPAPAPVKAAPAPAVVAEPAPAEKKA